MKRIYWLVLAALCLTTTALRAQSCPTPVSGAIYTYVTSFNASFEFDECQPLGAAKRRPDYHWTVCVWRTGPGAIELSINPASFSVEDSCNTIDNTPASTVFAVLGTESVRQAAILGHLTASSNCSSPSETTVTFPSCVTRTGSGSSTAFSTSGSSLCRSDYSFCQSGGTVIVALEGTSGASSCGTAEPTCTGGSNLE
jgi:hypothetical protein